MSTPMEFYSDPRKKALDHLNAECFALEQLAKQYGHDEIRAALFRVRCGEMSHAKTYLRGQIRREVEALSTSPVTQGAGSPPARQDDGAIRGKE